MRVRVRVRVERVSLSVSVDGEVVRLARVSSVEQS